MAAATSRRCSSPPWDEPTRWRPHLPSARSQGEPLTGRFALGAGEEVRHLVMGNEGEPYLIAPTPVTASSAKYDDLTAKNKNGKALLTVPEGASSWRPRG